MKDQDSKLSRDYITGQDAWVDKPFVRALIKECQGVHESIGAHLYPHLKLIVFWYKGIIIHKVFMNEDQTENITIEEHRKAIERRIEIINMGLIPPADMMQMMKNSQNLKTKDSQRLL